VNKIIEMAKQAGFDPHDMSSDFTCNLDDIEAFAKLIVRECADVATINAHEWASPGTYVLKHFGVEE
jgi:hypothetical protein